MPDQRMNLEGDLSELLASLPKEVADAIRVAQAALKMNPDPQPLELSIFIVENKPVYQLHSGEHVLFQSGDVPARPVPPAPQPPIQEAPQPSVQAAAPFSPQDDTLRVDYLKGSAPQPKKPRVSLKDRLPAIKAPQIKMADFGEWLTTTQARVQDWFIGLEIEVQPAQMGILVGALILAFFPAYLVYQARWQEVTPFTQDQLYQFWEVRKNPLFTYTPAFIVTIFACMLLLHAGGFLSIPSGNDLLKRISRKKETPAVYGDIPAARVRSGRNLLIGGSFLSLVMLFGAMRLDRPVGLLFLLGLALATYGLFRMETVAKKKATDSYLRFSLLAAHIALVLVLRAVYSRPGSLWWALILLVIAALNLYPQRKKITLTFWLVNLALIAYSYQMDRWWFAIVGDDWGFYTAAKAIVEDPSFGPASLLFKGNYVYGSHPYFSSLIQAAFMRGLGVNSFGWRFSNIYLCALSVPLFFSFLHHFLKKRYALLLTILIASSHYIMTFGKIGYNNLQGYFTLALTLWAVAHALKHRRTKDFFLLGLVTALNFYVYPAAIYSAPLPFLLFLFYYLPNSRERWIHWGVTLTSLIALISPLFLQPEYWTAKVPGTLMNAPQLMENSTNVFNHLFSNIVYTWAGALYTTEESHFLVGGYLDPVLGGLYVLGLSFLLWQAWRNRFGGFLLTAILYMIVVVGATHDRETPPNTRMYLMVPWFSMLGGVGLVWLRQLFEDAGFKRKLVRGILVSFVGLVIVSNLVNAYTVSFRRGSRYHSLETFMLKAAMQVYRNSESQDAQLVILTNDNLQLIDSFDMLWSAYDLNYERSDIIESHEIPVTDSEMLTLIAAPNTIVLVDPRVPDEQRAMLTTQTIELSGKSDCNVVTIYGHPRFHLWYPAQWPWACPSPGP